MKLEIIDTNYMLKKLAVDIKELDKTLTKYLIDDMYNPKEVDKKKVFNEISYIKNLLEYISQEYKNEIMEQEELYEQNDIIRIFDCSKNIREVWSTLLEIKEKIGTKENIEISHEKGFDFGFGYSNYSSLRIYHITKIDHCHNYKQIINVSTTTGKMFRIFKCEEYYKLLNLDMEDYRRNINREFSCDTIEETIEKINELLIPFEDTKQVN